MRVNISDFHSLGTGGTSPVALSTPRGDTDMGADSGNCTQQYTQLLDPQIIGSLVPLGLICLTVTFGNMLVISAVRTSSKLRGPTNLLIVSLAVADLLLGVLILPMSAIYEVLDVWVLGSELCFVWLSVDVLTSTASILHLVVISLDRYIAVTHPVNYPNIMTTSRAKLMICGVWSVSFIICFPPLVGWNTAANGTDTMGYNATVNCAPTCTLSSDPGYVIYSAVGSFFGPMLVMIFFNWRIYRTAKRTTKAIRQGFTRVKNGGEDIGGLGIHRGKSTRMTAKECSERKYVEVTSFSNYNKSVNNGSERGMVDPGSSVESCLQPGSGAPDTPDFYSALPDQTRSFQHRRTGNSGLVLHRSFGGEREPGWSGRTCRHLRRTLSDQGTQTNSSFLSTKSLRKKRLKAGKEKRFSFLSIAGSQKGKIIYRKKHFRLDSQDKSPTPSPTSSTILHDGRINKGEPTKAFAKRNIKIQVRKFRMETKAAKTIGVIVGCFVVCWLPFFTIYIGRVFCKDPKLCVPDLLFSVFFWLGYCNSALNPFIYALFARDFRNAFKKIICKIFCKNVS